MTLYTRPGTGQWIPAGVNRTAHRARPEVGSLIAFEFAAWTVMDVRDAELTEEEAEYLGRFITNARQADRLPYRVQLRRLHGPKHPNENDIGDLGLRTSVNFFGWDVYRTDRVPLCSCCGHPWPCRMSCAEEQAERSARTMSDRMDRIMPGACYGCGDPITPRQGSVVMPEGNVDIPGAPAPRFHTRQKCADERREYERRRQRQIGQPIQSTQEQLP